MRLSHISGLFLLNVRTFRGKCPSEAFHPHSGALSQLQIARLLCSVTMVKKYSGMNPKEEQMSRLTKHFTTLLK